MESCSVCLEPFDPEILLLIECGLAVCQECWECHSCSQCFLESETEESSYEPSEETEGSDEEYLTSEPSELPEESDDEPS